MSIAEALEMMRELVEVHPAVDEDGTVEGAILAVKRADYKPGMLLEYSVEVYVSPYDAEVVSAYSTLITLDDYDRIIKACSMLSGYHRAQVEAELAPYLDAARRNTPVMAYKLLQESTKLLQEAQRLEKLAYALLERYKWETC